MQTRSQPMIYISARSRRPMTPEAIAPAMAEAFEQLGSFIGTHGIDVVGPPLAVYRDYERGQVTMDVGVPVAAAALGRAEGEIRAGATPVRQGDEDRASRAL